MNGFDTTLDDREVTQDCQVGQDGCVAITCFSGDNQVPCVNHEGITVTSCYWENAQAVDGQNGCLDHQI
jgi:hypothetical protein